MASPAGFGPPEPAAAAPAGFGPPEAAPEAPSMLESGLRGAAQGATLGFGDELSGAAEALYDKIRGHKEALGDLYVKHRDEARAANDAAEKANPGTYMAGNVVGGVAPLLIPGVGELAAGAKGAAAVGTGIGAASGLGSSTADLTKGDVSGAARDTALGGAAGAVGGLVGHGAAKVAGAAADALPAVRDALQAKVAEQAAAPGITTSLGQKVKDLGPAGVIAAMGHPVGAAMAAGGALLSEPAQHLATKVAARAAGALAEPGPITGAVGRVTKMLSNPASLGRYAGVLSAAAKQGPERLAATHYVLNSTDSSYRQHMAQAATTEANQDDAVEE